MKKLIVLFCTAFLTISVVGQNTKNHSGFLSTLSKQKELLLPDINDNFLKYHSQNTSSKQLPHLKEANALKQRLDSLVAPGFDKDNYFYDANGNMIQNIYSEWEENHWRYTAKYDNSFDAGGNLVKNITSNWENGQWVNFMKDEYTFDANGNQTQNVSFLWTNNEWVNYYDKDEYIFDANGNQTQHINYLWQDDQYLKSGKEESAFDENGDQTQNIRFLWDGNQWINGSKIEFTYDESGNQTQNIGYNWDNNLWVNSSKEEFVFDTNGKNTHFIGSGWDGENWFYIEKYETIYDANKNITQLVYSEWDVKEWLEAAKFEYQYDANGNMILSNLIYFFEDQQIIFMREESVYDDFGNRTSYSFYSFDEESEDFTLLPMWKQEYVYDNSFSFEDLILPFTSDDFEDDNGNEFEGEVGQFDLNLMFNHKLTNLMNYEHDGDNWVSTGDYTLYYSQQTITGANELKLANNVNVYPNPATNQVTFTIAATVGQLNVEFYDLQGKLVLNRMISNNNPVLIESLNGGLYFYRLSENQNFYTGKIMVK